ncbi:hypothetical protein DY000_02051754 [Brassica cretica]|uniref:Uncharacterized protein n=1 Tax=Brassica cretica TaxID=69181 RepID=A0ABQ7A751_BRACR|nr:hypothetical protein DY000_02051754 [Brassica cretica]
MNSDAGNSVARRRRRFSDAFHLFVSLPLCFTMLLHEFLVCLGFLSSFAITSFRRCFRCRLYVLWFLCSPSLHLLTALVPDLTHDTCNSPHLAFSSQISDLKMTFLPTGKILSGWCWCECVSRTRPLRALLSRPMSLDGSNPGSLQKPLRTTHTNDCSIFLSLFELNDQRLGAGSVKSPCLHHGNAGVGSSCLESTLVPLELCVKLISVLTGEPLALDCLGWDSEGLYLLVGDCNSLSNARLLTPHSLLFQVTSSELVEVAGG